MKSKGNIPRTDEEMTVTQHEHLAKERAGNLKPLHGIRGFAVLLVLLSHAANDKVLLFDAINLSGAGHYGVFLFFVLSAFLLTRQFLELDQGQIFIVPVLRHYFLRRILRIYPLFIVALGGYLLLYKAGFLIVPLSLEMMLKSLLLLDAEEFFWTIPVEFQYYFILPLMAFFLVKISNSYYLLLGGVLFCLGWQLLFPPQYTAHVLPFLPTFVLGSLTAKAYKLIHERKVSQQETRTDTDRRQNLYNFLAWAIVVSFFLLVPNILEKLFGSWIKQIDIQHQFLLFGLLSSGLILTTLLGNGRIRHLMESSFFTFWGKVSFSAYLGHKVLLALIHDFFQVSPPLQFILFFSATAFCSYLSYRYFEKPLAGIHVLWKGIEGDNGRNKQVVLNG